MKYLAYISFAFIAFQFMNGLLNFFFRQRIKKTLSPSNDLISVLIPARNEEVNLPILLEALQLMKNTSMEVLVYDDQSDDHTVQIVNRFIQTDKRIRLITTVALPNGWQGKNHACHQLSLSAKGKYFLFVDADVRLHGNLLNDAVDYLNRHHLGLLSVFPKQALMSLGEKMSVPIMNYILLTLLPLIFVRHSPFKSHAAANGQFMLFDAETYQQYRPHEQFKNSPVEDIEIVRYLKRNRVHTACITGEKRIECRMYHSYQEALAGFSKNIFMFFGNQPALAFLFWFFATLGFIPVVLTYPQLLLFYLSFVLLIQLLYSVACRQNIPATLFLFPVQLCFMLHVMIRGWIVQKSKKHIWKGRNIY